LTYFLVVLIGTILFGLQIESRMWMLLFFFGVLAFSLLVIGLAADIGIVVDVFLLTILAFFGYKAYLGL
jgi:hypothetical protein